MIGINGQPYVDASPFIDMAAISSLEKEICYGIARSKVQAGIYGPGIKDSEKYGNFLGLSAKYNKVIIPPEERLIYESLNRNQRALFFKLYEGLYSASTVVYLRTFVELGINSYLDKASASKTKFTDNAQFFPKTLDWISKLPFEEVGRVLFFIHEHDCKLLTHRDGTHYSPHNNEFLWINPCGTKNFFIYDEEKNLEHSVNSKAVFFNDLDMHGGHPTDRMTWSLRIDGVFTKEFREQLGIAGLVNY
jgi:hypothetical protein